MKLMLRLAGRDLAHDWQASACFVAALVGVLAPLLIVFALKNGVVAALLGQLIHDPSNRELIAVGAKSHDAAFFQDIAAREDVEFIVPSTRSINAVANAVRHKAARELELKVPMIPSAPGDPLSPEADVGPGRVLLSAKLAEKLACTPCDSVELRIERRINDTRETAVRDLQVAGIVPAERYGRDAMFISVQDLVAVEQFRDNLAVSLETWDKPAEMPDTFASFRLYAQELQDVAKLEAVLDGRNVASRPRAENVDLLLSFDRQLTLLFVVIAGLATAGFWASMAASLRGSVERQRSALSLLKLLGVPDRQRRLFPLVQSIILVSAGVILTLVLVVPTLAAINALFTPDGLERIALLGHMHILGTLVFGLLVGISASIWAAVAIGDIQSDEILRAH